MGVRYTFVPGHLAVETRRSAEKGMMKCEKTQKKKKKKIRGVVNAGAAAPMIALISGPSLERGPKPTQRLGNVCQFTIWEPLEAVGAETKKI